MRRFLWMLLLCSLLIVPAHAQLLWQDESGTVEVAACEILEEQWLFLPSGTNLEKLRLQVDGKDMLLNWLAFSTSSEEMPDVHTGALPQSGETLHVMISEQLRSLHLQSDDPENEGRKWLEKCQLHERETTGRIVVLGEDGSVQLNMRLDSLRGRGNSTWQKAEYKKPYQFKLEYSVDLLRTGLPGEASRTWALLSHDEEDRTFLRNQVALDVAKELGLESTPRCEQVDLYYDGDYRGTYLLTEKIGVGANGVDIVSFDKLLKPINKKYGAPDPDDLPSPTELGNVPPVPDGYTDRGLPYGYANGVYDNAMVDAGGYLLELTSFGTLSDQGWFKLPDGLYMSVKNPEYAGETMLRYVSELFMNAYDTLLHYGYHPVTGAPLERFVDIDSFTRSHLVYELFLCADAYSWSSTFFVIPQGETKLYAGPVWDFDRWKKNRWPGLKDDNELSRAFYRTTAFQQAAKEICRNELAPMLENILFGTREGRYLKPLAVYQQTISRTWRMNFYRFFAQTQSTRNVPERFEETQAEFTQVMKSQADFLLNEVECWSEDAISHEAQLTFALPCGNPQSDSLTGIENEPHGSLFLEEVSFENITPATEDAYGVWQTTFTIGTKPDCHIAEDTILYVNGEPYEGTLDGDTLILSFNYEDPTYRPAVLDGVDYGAVFDYEYYVDSYPELIDQYGEDREAILRHFRDVGMEEGESAIEHFDPIVIFDSISEAAELYETDWDDYYKAFMKSPGKWMKELGYVYEPELTQVK